MSLNNIIATINNSEPSNYGVLNGKVYDIAIDGNIYVKENNKNREGYVLQCYAPYRARFLPPKILNVLTHDVFPILEVGDQYYNFTDESAEDNFELIDNDKLECIAAGVYWITIKISKINGTFSLQTTLDIVPFATGEIEPVFHSQTSTPYTPASGGYGSNYTSFLYRCEVGDTFKLRRSFLPIGAIPGIYEDGISNITFLKLNTD